MTEHLYKLGAHVTMACRNSSKCEKAAAKIREDNQASTFGTVVTGTIDTERMGMVRDFALHYLQENEGKPLDMLFLNAGGVFRHPTLTCVPKSEDGIEKVFAANYLGHHLLYRLLEPMLLESKLARVSTSSAACFQSFSYQVATDIETLNGCSEPFQPSDFENYSYGQSKLAQIIWTKYLSRRRLGPNSSIYVNAFHPGLVATEIAEKQSAMKPFSPLVQKLVDWMVHERGVIWTPNEGALTGLLLGAATDRLVKDRIRGKYFHPQSQEVINPVFLNETLEDLLWDFSEELVKDFLVVSEKVVAAE